MGTMGLLPHIPVVQGQLEHDYPDSELVPQLHALVRGQLSEDEFTLAQKRYLVFLTCQMRYDRYVEQHETMRRQRQSCVQKLRSVNTPAKQATAVPTSMMLQAGTDAQAAHVVQMPPATTQVTPTAQPMTTSATTQPPPVASLTATVVDDRTHSTKKRK
uniref:Small capsomere-interacting protein n=1 Tax=Otarine gammaherpesvirus 4 TaxID=2801541 RepID=A0A889IWA4_9GAMA|nr:hypothetical protein [Otarine gammaherpesvirus 4]